MKMTIIEEFETYDEVKQFIRKYELDNGYKFNMRTVASNFSKKPSHLIRRKIRFGRETLPYLYMSNGVTSMVCSLGGRLQSHVKAKTKADGSPLVTGKRKRRDLDESGKGLPVCTATIRILSLIYFPDYPVVDGMSKEVLSRHLENLRKEFNSETVFLTHFIVEIDENHSKHRHNPIVILDRQIIDRMQGLVERGYYTPSDILQQLNKYYQTLPVRPDKSDPKFYPSIERVRSLTYSHMMKQRNAEREKGFSTELAEVFQKMAVFENKTLTSYICCDGDDAFGQHDVYRAARSSPILTIADSENRCRLDTGGVPYIILATQIYGCSHGITYKHRFRDPYTPKERRRLNKEGMVMCTARCIFKEIALFPAYRVDNNAKERPIREAIIQKLQEDLRNQTAPYERGVAYAFPCADEHCGHFVKEVDGHLLLDDRVKSQISELAAEGVRSVAEMKRHLKMFLKHMFSELDMPGPFNRKFRPSNQTIINFMYHAGVPMDEIIIDVKDPVSYTHMSNFLVPKADLEAGHPKDEIETALKNVLDKNSDNCEFEALLKGVEIEQMKQNEQLNTAEMAAVKPGQEPSSFSSTVFQKQSECQTLLEEILQSVYAMSDMFRLRDLKEMLKRVTVCLKGGELMCDGIPVNDNNKELSASENSGETLSDEPVAADASVQGTSTEPSTKLFIVDEHEKVTEVEVPNDESTEIVLYQGYTDTGEEVIVVNEKKQKDQDHKTCAESSMKSTDVEKKGMIKVTCKDYFTTEQILRSLNIMGNACTLKTDFSKKLSRKVLQKLGACYDLETEKKNQEKEMLKYEKDKMTLSKMEQRLIKNEGLQTVVQKDNGGDKNGESGIAESPLQKDSQECMQETQTKNADDTCVVAHDETENTMPSDDSTELENDALEPVEAPIKKARTQDESKPLVLDQSDHSYNRIIKSSIQKTTPTKNSSFLTKRNESHDARKPCIENITDITFQIETMTPRAKSKGAANTPQTKTANLDSGHRAIINEMLKSTKSARIAVFKVSQSPQSSAYSGHGINKDQKKRFINPQYVIQAPPKSKYSEDPDWRVGPLAMRRRKRQMHFSKTEKTT